MDMSKYLDLFLSESREHLEEAAEAIARLEENPSDQELLNLLFRHGHSIKGMAASMGYDPIARLSHALEDRFDDIRKGKARFTPALARAALAAIDAISDALDGLERGEDPPAALGSLAAQLRETDGDDDPGDDEGGGTPPAPTAPPDSFPSPPAGGGGVHGAGGIVFNAEITLLPSVPMPAARALVLYKKLESLGKILFASPDKRTISEGRFGGRLLVQFSSSADEERMRQDLASFPEVQSVVLAPYQAPEEPASSRPAGPGVRRPPAPVPAPGPTIRIQTDSLDRFLDHLGELIIHGSRLENALFPGPSGKAADALDAMRKALGRLRADLMRLRMIPFEHIASRFVRSVRNLGGNLGKRVTLSIHGREVRLDRSILEDLVDPINHILRNAVDHGIESPEERAAAGKDKVGRINIRNTSYSDSVTIEIEDDGRGMDVDKIRRTAIEHHFITAEEAQSLSEAEVLMLVTTPGFSTAERLTEVSGRGVGMDVVRTRIESVGGRLRIASVPGEGTRILLHLPLTIAVIHAFLVRSGDHVYAVPVTRVRRTFEVFPAAIQHLGSVPVMRLGEETVELVFLGELLEDGGPVVDGNGIGSRPALLYFRDERPMGLVVDAVLAKRDIVVKPLRSPLENLREFTGATLLEDGRIALILDVHNLSRLPA